MSPVVEAELAGARNAQLRPHLRTNASAQRPLDGPALAGYLDACNVCVNVRAAACGTAGEVDRGTATRDANDAHQIPLANLLAACDACAPRLTWRLRHPPVRRRRLL